MYDTDYIIVYGSDLFELRTNVKYELSNNFGLVVGSLVRYGSDWIQVLVVRHS